MKVQMRSRRQITLPEEAVSELGVSEGDEFLVKVEDGSLRLLPVVSIPGRRRIYSPALAGGFATSRKGLRDGEYATYDNVDDLLKDLSD